MELVLQYQSLQDVINHIVWESLFTNMVRYMMLVMSKSCGIQSIRYLLVLSLSIHCSSFSKMRYGNFLTESICVFRQSNNQFLADDTAHCNLILAVALTSKLFSRALLWFLWSLGMVSMIETSVELALGGLSKCSLSMITSLWCCIMLWHVITKIVSTVYNYL